MSIVLQQLLQQHKAMLEEKDKLIDELQDQLKHMHMVRYHSAVLNDSN